MDEYLPNPVLKELRLHTNLLKDIIKKLSKNDVDEYFTIQEAAKILKRSRSTIRQWIKKGMLEGVKLNNTKQDRYLIPRESIKLIVNKNRFL